MKTRTQRGPLSLKASLLSVSGMSRGGYRNRGNNPGKKNMKKNPEKKNLRKKFQEKIHAKNPGKNTPWK